MAGLVNRVPYRAQPAMPVQAYRTFSVHMPIATHWRPASCEEVGCKRYAKGWQTPFVPGTPAGEKIRYQIRNSPIRRKWTVMRLPDKTVVTFEAGQQCFMQDHPATHHKLPVFERPQIHVIRGGDWRARTTERRIVGSDEWLDRFAHNQDVLKTRIEQDR